ncbi:MAG: histidinol-phosphate transaminase [Saezia sp.]
MSEVSQYWSDGIESLKPYIPGEQIKGRRVTRLNTNENPYPPSPMVKEALLKSIGADAEGLRLYPSFAMGDLKDVLAKYHHVQPEQIFLGNGSDEVLGHVFNGLFRHQRPILMPDISYSFYPVYSRLFGIENKCIPLRADFSIGIDDYLTPENQANGGIIIANPNAPTGMPLSADEILRLVKANQQSAVVIDEAYVDYGAETMIPHINAHKNLLVVRTFSKSRSLAGLRIGYAVGDVSLIQALDRMKDSFNSFPVDTLAQVAAIASVQDDGYFEKRRLEVIQSRAWLSAELKKLGFSVLPSAANFVFATTPQKTAAELQEQIKQRDILVRYFKLPRIENYLRITIGTQDECEQLVNVLREILN